MVRISFPVADLVSTVSPPRLRIRSAAPASSTPQALQHRPKTDRAAREPVNFADDERVAAAQVGQRPIKLGTFADARYLLSKNLGASSRLKIAHLRLEAGRLVRRRRSCVAD